MLSSFPHPPEEDSSSPVPFFHLLERLKTTKREGWRRFGIQQGESISDHMYRMSIMTMFAPPPLAAKLNIPHCIKMALVHDMAEAVVGDITPLDKVSKPEKARREASVMEHMTKNLMGGVPGGTLTGEGIMAVFQEYEENSTLEAQYVHDVDKMEMLLQMIEYEREYGLDLAEFCHVVNRIELPEIKEWAYTVLKEREEFWKKKNATNGASS